MFAPINRIVKSLFAVLILIAGSSSAIAQQAGTIRGTVVNENNEPISDINIGLQGTSLGNASDSQGKFIIRRVPAGNYTIVASGVGFSTERKDITLQPGQLLRVDVQLSKSNQRLQEIIVSAAKINKFDIKESPYVAKVPLDQIDNPQVYNSISSELLEDQVVTEFDQVFQNAPGIIKLWETTGRGGDGAGYYSLRGFPVQPTMVNGLPSLTNGSLDPANIERVEILKGPSGTLYGSSLISYGGLINVVTKKPYDSFRGQVSYNTGSYGLNRVTADVNTPLSETNNVNLRINGAFHTKNSFQDAGFSESYFIAPSLSYQATDKLSFLVNTEFLSAEHTNPTMLFLSRSVPSQASNLEELNYDNELSFTSNDLTISNPAFSLQGQMKYELSENWTSQTAISRSRVKSDGIYSYVYDFTPDGSNVFSRYINNQNSTTLSTDIQQNFNGNFEFAGIKNKTVLGLDYYQQRVINNSSGYIPFGAVSPQGEVQDPDNPTNLTQSAAEAALSSAPLTKSETEDESYSAYALNVFEFHPMLSAMASIRVDRFNNEGNTATEDDNFEQTAFSPKFGVVFQPIPEKLSLFANYMNGYSNVAPRVQDDGSTATFEPEKANQWETGIKTNLYNGRLSATVSYYDITVSNVVRQDPDRVNFYIQDGENYSRGVEASVTASPVDGLNIIAGYSFNESEVVKTDSDQYLGRRPESAGPKKLANAWASYQFTGGPLEGFGIGVGGNYASENKILNRESTGVFALPSYTIYNASIFYNSGSYRFDLKTNNFTDEEYYKGWSTINPQQPRSVVASFSYKF